MSTSCSNSNGGDGEQENSAPSSLLGNLATLLSSSRVGEGNGGSGQAIQLETALSDLLNERGSSKTSVTVPSLSARPTAASLAQQMFNGKKNGARFKGPQDSVALKLSTPLSADGPSITKLPGQIRDNSASTLSSLIDSRLSSSLSALARQTLKLGSVEEAKSLANLLKSHRGFKSDITAVVTTFRLLRSIGTTDRCADASADEKITLPLIFEIVADVSILNKTDTLMMTAQGSITGTFTPDGIIDQASIAIDTVSLLTAMVTQARKISKRAVKRAAQLTAAAQAQAREQQKQKNMQHLRQLKLQSQQNQMHQPQVADFNILSTLSDQTLVGGNGSLSSIASLLSKPPKSDFTLNLGTSFQNPGQQLQPNPFFPLANADSSSFLHCLTQDYHHQKPQQHRPLRSEAQQIETRKMIDSNEGLPASLATAAAELREENEEAIKRRKRRRTSSTSSTSSFVGCASTKNLLNLAGDDGSEHAQPMTLSSLFAAHDKKIQEQERRDTAVEDLTQSNVVVEYQQQEQEKQSVKLTEDVTRTPQRAESSGQLASWLQNAGLLGAKGQQHQVQTLTLQPSAPSTISILSDNSGNAIIGGNLSFAIGSLSTASLLGRKRKHDKTVSFNMKNETF